MPLSNVLVLPRPNAGGQQRRAAREPEQAGFAVGAPELPEAGHDRDIGRSECGPKCPQFTDREHTEAKGSSVRNIGSYPMPVGLSR